MITELNTPFRYRGDRPGHWTVYLQEATEIFFSGSGQEESMGSVGRRYRGDPGTHKNSRWEALV